MLTFNRFWPSKSKLQIHASNSKFILIIHRYIFPIKIHDPQFFYFGGYLSGICLIKQWLNRVIHFNFASTAYIKNMRGCTSIVSSSLNAD